MQNVSIFYWFPFKWGLIFDFREFDIYRRIHIQILQVHRESKYLLFDCISIKLSLRIGINKLTRAIETCLCYT